MPQTLPEVQALQACTTAMLRRVAPPHPSQLCRAVRFAPQRQARQGRGALQLTAAQRPAAGGGGASGERPALQAYLLELQLLGEPTREAVQAFLKEQRKLEARAHPPTEERGASGPPRARRCAQPQDVFDDIAALCQAFQGNPRAAVELLTAVAELLVAILKFAPPSPSKEPADQQKDHRAAQRREAAQHKRLAAAWEAAAAVREELAAAKATLAAQDQAAAVQRKAAAAAARREAAARKELAAAKATIAALEARPPSASAEQEQE